MKTLKKNIKELFEDIREAFIELDDTISNIFISQEVKNMIRDILKVILAADLFAFILAIILLIIAFIICRIKRKK